MRNAGKPQTLKVISGTDRADRNRESEVTQPPIDWVPPPPDWLPNAHAVKEWNHLAPILVQCKLLTEAGLAPLGMLCALTGKLIQLWAAGESPTGHMLAQYRGLVTEFGLTPMAQGRIKTVDQTGKANPFKKLKGLV